MSLTHEQKELLQAVAQVYASGHHGPFIFLQSIDEMDTGRLVYVGRPNVIVHNVDESDFMHLEREGLLTLRQSSGNLSGKPTMKGINLAMRSIPPDERMHLPQDLEETPTSSRAQAAVKRAATPQSLWNGLHPSVVQQARTRFENGHRADAVEAALKEVNSVVKEIVKSKIGEELDGANLMNRAFSLQQPIIELDDLSKVSGKDIQKGYMQIFAGAMTGIRNPKAHANIEIDENRAVHLLHLASLLMYKIDERKSPA